MDEKPPQVVAAPVQSPGLPAATPSPSTAVAQAPEVPKKDIKEKLNGIKGKFSGIKIPKKLIIVLVVFVVLLVLLSVVVKTVGNKRPDAPSSPTPTMSPTPTPVSELPSQYADDADVASIKTKMEELDRDLDAAVFRDDTLRVPRLDFDVDF